MSHPNDRGTDRMAHRKVRTRQPRHPVLRELSADECTRRMAEGGIGRVVMTTDRGPVAVPVSYEYTDGQIIFSTDPAKAVLLQAQETIGFEVDRVDEFLTDGWSVLVTGRARVLEQHGRVSSFDLECWNDGRLHTLVTITPELVTGRAIESPSFRRRSRGGHLDGH